MEVLNIIKSFILDDLTVFITTLLEIAFFLFASIIGALFRNKVIRRYFGIKKDIGFTIISTVVLFCLGNYLRNNINDSHILFGICTIISAYLPNFLILMTNFEFLKKIVKIIFPALKIIWDEMNRKDSIEPVDEKEFSSNINEKLGDDLKTKEKHFEN